MVAPGGQVGGERDELGRHHPAGRFLGVGEELAELVGLVLLHEREELLARRIREVRHEVGRVVGRHLLEDVGRALRGELLEDLDLRLGLHLLDGVGHRLVVERGQDARPVARRELVDDRGEVGRVELGQAGVRHAQADRGDGGLDRVDVLPVDVALGRRAAAGSGRGSGTRPRCRAAAADPPRPRRRRRDAADHRRRRGAGR